MDRRRYGGIVLGYAIYSLALVQCLFLLRFLYWLLVELDCTHMSLASKLILEEGERNRDQFEVIKTTLF